MHSLQRTVCICTVNVYVYVFLHIVSHKKQEEWVISEFPKYIHFCMQFESINICSQTLGDSMSYMPICAPTDSVLAENCS